MTEPKRGRKPAPKPKPAPTPLPIVEDEVLTVPALSKAMLELQAENQALKLLARLGMVGEHVTIRSLGYVTLEFVTEEGRSILLGSYGSPGTASLPVATYEKYKRQTDWFDKGYVQVVGVADDNPNAISDAAEWIDAKSEETATDAVNALISEGAIIRLWCYLEEKAKVEPLSGVELVIKRALSRRSEEVTGTALVEDV
jgi:hypothetical protein